MDTIPILDGTESSGPGGTELDKEIKDLRKQINRVKGIKYFGTVRKSEVAKTPEPRLFQSARPTRGRKKTALGRPIIKPPGIL